MIATIDITSRCTLRCRHCYFFAVENPPELSDEAFLIRVRELVRAAGLRSAFWVGGEPLLRLPLMRRAMPLFERNAVATSGMVPIPKDLPAGLLVSIDGLEETHDRVRGSGSFGVVCKHVSALAPRSFGLSVTLTAATIGAVDELEELVERTAALGAFVGFATGPARDPLVPNAAARERAVDALLALRARRADVVLNTAAGLEQLRSTLAARAASDCMYQSGRAVAFDTALQVKPPCTFGARANCELCGCPVVAEQRTRSGVGGAEAEGLLRALFPRWSPVADA